MINDADVDRLLKVAVGVYPLRTGILLLKGNDARDFLHRMSTNDMLSLSAGASTITILINEKARVIDLVRVIARDDGLLLVTSEAASNIVQAWLHKFIIMEDVQIIDLSGILGTLILMGDHATKRFEEFGLSVPRVTGGNSHVEVASAGGMHILTTDDRWPFSVLNLLAPKDAIERTLAGVQQVSAYRSSDIFVLTDDMYDTARIEQGLPTYGKELTDQINPLEAGLQRFISSTKGCYIGQEVVARISTYNKQQMRLTGLVFHDVQAQPSTRGKIWLEKEEVGWTTSHCHSSKIGHPIALGYLRTHVTASKVMFNPSGTDIMSTAQVVDLPFRG